MQRISFNFARDNSLNNKHLNKEWTGYRAFLNVYFMISESGYLVFGFTEYPVSDLAPTQI